MTAAQYRAIRRRLGLSHAELAGAVGVDARTSRRWAEGTRAVPDSAAAILRLLLSGKITIQDVEEARR